MSLRSIRPNPKAPPPATMRPSPTQTLGVTTTRRGACEPRSRSIPASSPRWRTSFRLTLRWAISRKRVPSPTVTWRSIRHRRGRSIHVESWRLRAATLEPHARTSASSFHANPAYAVAHYDLALAEERLGRYDAAERELRAALALAPTYARAQLALGVLLLRQGRRAEARVAFAQATRDATDPVLQNLAAAMRDSITI